MLNKFRTSIFPLGSGPVSLRKIANICNNDNNVIIQDIGDKGVIILNRPQALNSLTLSMVKKIYAVLQEWETQKSAVIIKGAGEKAFCSGGDLLKLYKENDIKIGTSIMKQQYVVNALIGAYKIPYVAIIDGIVMGGGAGLSINGRYRIATERTMFAVPEPQIGAFPDCGASFFLPRLSGYLGWYLAFTGHRLKGSDVFKCGLATHYCDSKYLSELETELLNCSKTDISTTLNKFHIDDDREFELTPVMEKINNYFSGETVEDIISKLKEDGSTWANKTLNNMLKCNPTSLKVTLKQFELGKQLTLQECLQMEHRLASKIEEDSANAFEGVRAVVINREQKPNWNPRTLSEVSEEDVLSHFQASQ